MKMSWCVRIFQMPDIPGSANVSGGKNRWINARSLRGCCGFCSNAAHSEIVDWAMANRFGLRLLQVSSRRCPVVCPEYPPASTGSVNNYHGQNINNRSHIGQCSIADRRCTNVRLHLLSISRRHGFVFYRRLIKFCFGSHASNWGTVILTRRSDRHRIV